MTTRILLTRGLSNVRDAISLIHQAMIPGEFYLGAIYPTPLTPLRGVADAFFPEPAANATDDDAEWLLDLCRQHHFAWVWPQSRWEKLFDVQHRFAAAGVRLILPCPDVDTLDALQDKARANARLAATGVPLPQTLPVATAAEFIEALAVLGTGGRPVCVKPARSIYGLGFRRIDDQKTALDRLLSNDSFTMGSAELAAALADAAGRRPFLVMEYLAGVERSIDCLALAGHLVRAVVRCKSPVAQGRWQLIEDNPEAWTLARRVVAEFRLNGLINIQTRERVHADGRREQCFLEVNPRMSGGIDMACQSGLNLPYWLLRLVTETIEETAIPQPGAGMRVAKIEQAVTL